MQFERIRKNHKRKIVIGGLIILCITSAITITTTRAKYKLTEDIELAKGTINYKSYDFKIMAMYQSEDKTNYTEINAMPSNGYVINEEKTYCTTDNNTKVKGKIKTINGIHGLYDITKNDKCYLYFDKKTSVSDTILGNITINSGTPTFSNIAKSDEGVYKISDGMYGKDSYYWRGSVANNYVKFGGFCWRIVRINGDGTIRLIYDGVSCHANGTSTTESLAKTDVKYNTIRDKSYYVGYTFTTNQRPSLNVPQINGNPSNVKNELESWYSNNLASHASKIADGKYCNDRNIGAKYSNWSGTWATTWSANGPQIAYAGIDRLWNKYQPTLSCPDGDIYSLKVGLLTADEVELAGGKDINNNAYYLYNGQQYWTMTPAYMSSSSSWSASCGGAGVFIVDSGGRLLTDNVEAYSCVTIVYDNKTSTASTEGYGLRPVINLKSDITFSSGSGTLTNPYVVA